MARNTKRAAEAAAVEASEAARTLAQRSHEARAEKVEVAPEPEQPKERSVDPNLREKLLQNRHHSQAMDEILKKRGLDQEEEKKEEPKVEAKEEPKPAVEEPKAEEAPPAVAEAAEAPETPKTVRVKVDGEEFDAPADEVEAAGGVKAYQVLKAGENRLKKANDAVAESKKLTAQLVELLSKRQAPEAPKQTDDEFIKSKVDVIRFGTPEESATALREVLLRAQPKQVDHNAILAQTLQAIDRKQATAEFGTKFPEIVSNPLLVKLAISLEQEEIAKAQQERRAIDWKSTYDRIGNQIRGVVPARQSQSPTTPQTAGNTSPAPSAKEERKASITVLPTASARAELPKVEKELTPEEERKEWIAEQRKARGQG